MEHLEAAWMALQCRHEATKAWRNARSEAVLATASPMKRRRVGGHAKRTMARGSVQCVKVDFLSDPWRISNLCCVMTL